MSDLTTGLQWEKKNNLDDVFDPADPHDADGTYIWTASDAAADGTAYTNFLAKLNNGTSSDGAATTPITGCFAGHCDWRLPTIAELQGIVDVTKGACGGGTSACIDPAFGTTQDSFYWSATTVSDNPLTAWSVGGRGLVTALLKSTSLYVRAVRGGL